MHPMKIWRVFCLGKKGIMKIKNIKYPADLCKIDKYKDNIDVFVDTEDGQHFVVTVCTPKFYEEYMDKEGVDFIAAGSPDIIVRELTDENIRKALEDFCRDDGYWIKSFYLLGEISEGLLDKEMVRVREINWEGIGCYEERILWRYRL